MTIEFIKPIKSSQAFSGNKDLISCFDHLNEAFESTIFNQRTIYWEKILDHLLEDSLAKVLYVPVKNRIKLFNFQFYFLFILLVGFDLLLEDFIKFIESKFNIRGYVLNGETTDTIEMENIINKCASDPYHPVLYLYHSHLFSSNTLEWILKRVLNSFNHNQSEGSKIILDDLSILQKIPLSILDNVNIIKIESLGNPLESFIEHVIFPSSF